MGFPGFLGPSQTLNLNALGGAPVVAPSSNKLSFTVSAQTETNWCWAAVSSSVSTYYTPASTFTQCTIVNTAFSRNDCCGGGASNTGTCNRPWYLDQALTVTQNLKSFLSRTLTFAEVQTEIGISAPIGTRVGWNGGGGHFQAICGWLVGASGIEYIDITDPIYLGTQIPFSSFAGSYQSGGTWSHSYLTEPPPPLGGSLVTSLGITDQTAIGA